MRSKFLGILTAVAMMGSSTAAVAQHARAQTRSEAEDVAKYVGISFGLFVAALAILMSGMRKKSVAPPTTPKSP